MKVAIVQEIVDNRRGGAETSTLEMARQLARLGLDVTVVCRVANGTALREEFGAGRVAIRALVPGVTRSNFAGTRKFIEAAASASKTGEFNVVHAITPCPGAAVYQPRGGTYVETIRRSVELGRTPLTRFFKQISRKLNRRQQYLLAIERELLTSNRPPLVAAVSDYVRRQIAQDYPNLPAENTIVAFNGVDVTTVTPTERARRRADLRAELGIRGDLPLVLFAAHNFKLKGLAELVQAADITGSRRQWTAIVVGRDNPRPYQRLARRRGVGARFRFLGPRGDMPNLFAGVDLLAHPTWYDPCSRVVLEALCHGVPVVTTRFNGAAEVVLEGRNGAVIGRPDDLGGLAAAIDECLSPRLAAMCLSDAAVTQERLSMARHARELEQVYRRIMHACATANPRN